jgi:DNA-binding response OmpR family regulator
MLKRPRQAATSILIVDRDDAARRHAAQLGLSLGFDTVWQASSVERALRACKATPFNLAIVELDLGDRHGEDLVLALRGWPGSVDFILAVSLDQERLRKAASMRLPALAFLQKPLHLRALTGCLGARLCFGPKTSFDMANETVEVD